MIAKRGPRPRIERRSNTSAKHLASRERARVPTFASELSTDPADCLRSPLCCGNARGHRLPGLARRRSSRFSWPPTSGRSRGCRRAPVLRELPILAGTVATDVSECAASQPAWPLRLPASRPAARPRDRSGPGFPRWPAERPTTTRHSSDGRGPEPTLMRTWANGTHERMIRSIPRRSRNRCDCTDSSIPYRLTHRRTC